MYNDRRYSLARYSANQGIKAVELAASFSETMGAVAGPAVPVGLRARFAETLRASALGTITAVSAFQGVEGLSASAAMSADVISGAAFSSRARAPYCHRMGATSLGVPSRRSCRSRRAR